MENFKFYIGTDTQGHFEAKINGRFGDILAALILGYINNNDLLITLCAAYIGGCAKIKADVNNVKNNTYIEVSGGAGTGCVKLNGEPSEISELIGYFMQKSEDVKTLICYSIRKYIDHIQHKEIYKQQSEINDLINQYKENNKG